MGRPRISREDAIALALLAGTVLLLFGPALAGYLVEHRDLPRWALVGRSLWREAVLAGELPEWNPHVGLGSSTLAAPVHGTFYPGHLLLLLGPAHVTVPVLWLLHGLLAGVGGYALARALGCRPATALLGGLALAVGGYAVSMWGNGEKLLTCAWLPWAALALVALARAPQLFGKRLAAAGAALALIALAGDPFVLLHAALLGVPLAVATLAPDRRELPRVLGRVAARSLLALGLALLLAAPALVPALAQIGLTDRGAALPLAEREAWSLHPIRLFELLAPGALGDPLAPGSYAGASYVSDDAPGSTPWAIALYGGIAVLLFAPLAGRSRRAIGLWIAAAGALLLALGRHLPLHSALGTIFPPLGLMRFPEKHFAVVAVALALLAAIGLERAVGGRIRAWLAAPALLLVGILAIVVAPVPLRPSLLSGLAHAGFAAALLGGGLVLSRRRPALIWLLPVVVAFDLLLAAWPLMRWIDSPNANEPPPLARAIAEAESGGVPARLYRDPRAGGAIGGLPPNVGALYGVAHLPGHETTSSRRLHRLWDRLVDTGSRALVLLDHDYLLLPEAAPVPAGTKAVATAGGLRLLRAPELPRAVLVDRVRVLDDEGALDLLGAPTFDPLAEALVAPGPASTALSGGGAPGSCAIESYAAKRVEVRCSATSEALMVLRDQHWPGWSAKVNGKPAPVVRANLVLRGVYLDPGAHRIVFTFSSPGLPLGLALGGAGILAAGLLLWRGRHWTQRD